MATRLEMVNQLNNAQQSGDVGAASELLTEDVSVSIPMQGTVSGKQAVIQALQQAASQARQFGISWSEPVESGDKVERKASTMMGPLVQRISFREDKICMIEIVMG